MERIIAAAYKVKPEYIYKGGGCVLKISDSQERDDIYQCRIARHHAEILHMYCDEIDHDTDGFYTSYGRWVDRREAARIAIESGQIKKCHYFGGEELDSSDIFDLDYDGNLILK
jgi:hypothetical protein